jgi:hypothetical protein
MKTFITFSDGYLNDELTKVLQESISTFSKYPLKVYKKEDFDVQYDTNDPTFWSSGKGYVYKILSCLKALEEYDEVVWIDTDCVVTNYIDKIWFESWRINSYPLLPKYRFNVFKKELSNGMDLPDVSESWFLENGKNKVGVYTVERKFYSQACFMFFNNSCKNFLEETLGYFNDYDSDCFPNGDESIINCLLWKYKFNDSLGDIFLCSHFFGYYMMHIISINERDRFMDINYTPSQNIFENILFLHGNKNPMFANEILKSLIENRIGNKK